MRVCFVSDRALHCLSDFMDVLLRFAEYMSLPKHSRCQLCAQDK